MVNIDHSHNATAFIRGRGGNKIRYIVIHHWDDPANHPSYEGVIRWFEKGGRNTSAHYVVEAGRIAQLVADGDTAYHAGNWGVNQRSIGIECNPRCSEEDKRTVGELVKLLLNKYGNLRIVGHMDIKSTDCPGRYYPPAKVLSPYISSASSAVFSHAAPSTPPSPSQSGGDVQRVAREVIDGHWGNGDTRRQKLEAAGYNYKEVQDCVNKILGGASSLKPVSQVAQEVINGRWGNGDARRRKLESAGYNYREVQNYVNKLLRR